MPKERKDLTVAIATAVDDYNKTHPDLRVSETILSLIAVWRHLWKQCPKHKNGKRDDGTPGWIGKPPGIRQVYQA
jgi:hypothetical protein